MNGLRKCYFHLAGKAIWVLNWCLLAENADARSEWAC